VASDHRRLSVVDRLLVGVGGLVGPLAIRALGSTWRMTTLGVERVPAARRAAGSLVFAFWHGTLLPLEHANRGRGVCVLSSWHRDGELSARVMAGLGYRVVRGSTSRGGARGIQMLVRAVRAGHDVAVTPDGPRGPARRAQAGAVYVAARSGAPVVPVGVAASRALRLGSWDRFLVPLPFSRVVVAYGEPLAFDPDAPAEAGAAALEAALARASAEAEAARRGPRVRASGTPASGARSVRASAASSAAYRAYRLASSAVGWAAAPVLRCIGVPPTERRERLGGVPTAAAGCLWVHAASVGEVAAAEPLVRELRRSEERVLLTTVTRGGRRAAARLEPLGVLASYAPLDTVGAVRRALRRARPRSILLVETELWPNLIVEAVAEGVAVGVVNGRISDRSARRSASAWSPLKKPAALLALAACQTGRDADRFRALGVRPDRAAVTGNTKFERDAAPLSEGDRERVRRSLGLPEGPVIVFGSVRPREERAVARAAAEVARASPDAVLLVAPRHLERVGAVARELERNGLAVRLRSRMDGPEGAARVVVLDTTGELAEAYGIGAAAFVGGTLAPSYGGHNPLEPAALGVPVVIGHHVAGCRDSAGALSEAGAAVVVRSAAQLSSALARFLNDRPFRDAASNAAISVVSSGGGALDRTVELLRSAGLLGSRVGGPTGGGQ